MANTTSEVLGSSAQSAKSAASTKFNEQKDSTASEMGNLAQALRKAAGGSNVNRDTSVGRVADLAADGLERLSGSLRSKDLDSLMRDAESFARSQPIAFFGAAVAAGFLAMRFIKSSRPQEGADLPADMRV